MTAIRPENIDALVPDPGAVIDALVAEGAISAAFQPIVDLSRGVIAGYESLARVPRGMPFRHAGELFEAAAREGRLWHLESAARAAALDGTARWRVGAKLFLNCSPAVLADPRFPATLDRQVRERGRLAPAQIVLEITERSEDQYVPGLADRVIDLKHRGFDVAIDDVGAGASGLNRIILLRPRWLKLDRELITGIDHDRVRQNLVRFMLHFGRLSGVQIIAEGIETEDELQSLIALGVRFGQGYLLGKPAPRCEPLDPELALRVHSLSARADDGRGRDERSTPASRYGQRARAARADATAADAAQLLADEPACPGLCVAADDRLIGWCHRDALLQAALREPGTRLAQLARPCTTAAVGGTTVPDAVELAACRDPDERDAPLVLTDGDLPVLVLTPTDVLRAAADLARSTAASAGSAVFASLPGRVQCDQHLRRAILEHRARADALVQPPVAAVFIDVRDLTSFNGAFGYELGDALLAELLGLIELCVVDGRGDVFLGRLGDDRFLVTAPEAGLATRLAELAERFDELACSYCGMVGEGARTDAPAGIGLRILVVRDALRRVDIPHELYRLEGPLRRLAESRALAQHAAVSQIVFDPPIDDAMRRSA